MKMNVVFPLSMECERMAIRAMYLTYDHLSDLSRTYDKPEDVPEHFQSGKSRHKDILNKIFCQISIR